MERETVSVEEALAELERVAPGAPLLALGQTVFWDEPMKAGIALAARKMGLNRGFVAGVHDTDYFAKFPSPVHESGRFRALPHNDTTTKGLWSAAGEFSSLFGSETVITRDVLQKSGLRIALLERARPGFLEQATEAWGWRGVASLDDHPPITAEVSLRQVWPELHKTLSWAVDLTVDSLTGEDRTEAERKAEQLEEMLCDARDEDGPRTLAGCYRQLLPKLAEYCTNTSPDIHTTTTTELLKFNRETCSLPRFQLVAAFIDPRTRDRAREAYNASLEGSGIFNLEKFGTGALPFDLVVPGRGRGTVRLGTRGAIIETPQPIFLSFKKPISGISEFAAAIESKLGPDCTLVGKALTLIGMLATEFVFVFHEGASSYVSRSRDLHGRLAEAGIELKCNPILRVKYTPWDALQVSCIWLSLPEPLRQPFGGEHICAQSFARKWRAVAREQEELLGNLGQLRRPIDLIRFLDKSVGGAWNRIAEEYEELHAVLSKLEIELKTLRSERTALYKKVRELRTEKVRAEAQKGEHFRAHIFEKEPSEADLLERERLTHAVEAAVHEEAVIKRRIRELYSQQEELVSSPEIRRVHERRRTLELEAELKRLDLIRDAVIASKGLETASNRPSAWWFPLVSPDGLWFRETVSSARCYLEPLR